MEEEGEKRREERRTRGGDKRVRIRRRTNLIPASPSGVPFTIA